MAINIDLSDLATPPSGSRIHHPMVGALLIATAGVGVVLAALLGGFTTPVLTVAWLVMAAAAGFAVSGST